MATKNVQNYKFDPLEVSGQPSRFLQEINVDTSRAQFDEDVSIDTYKSYYYSGGQAQIYLEDVFLDEVSNLHFSTVTNKSPIYGYASERFDTVAKGNMLIQGSFTINFVSVGYLQIISQIVRENNGDAKVYDEEEQDLLLNGVKFRNIKDASPFEVSQAINQIRGYGNYQFRFLANKMRERKKNKGVIHSQFYELPPFDIFAVFGDVNYPGAAHTVRRIKDVYLTGQSQVVSTSGEPVMEQYSFIARDIG